MRVTESRVSVLSPTPSLLAAAVFGMVVSQGASAQSTVPVPVRPEGFVFTAPSELSVLETTPTNQPLAPASRPDLQQPAVPVAQVMNGGGFGYTGFDYYHDQYSEGRLGEHQRPRTYVVAPAYVTPPRN